jgi:hypothetical protein
MNEVTYRENPENIPYYKTTMEVIQMSFDMSEELVKYTLYNVFPISVSQVSLGSENVGAIGEYTVNFAFTHFDVEDLKSNFGIDSIANEIISEVQNFANDTIEMAKKSLSNSIDIDFSHTNKKIENFASSLKSAGESWSDRLLGD